MSEEFVYPAPPENCPEDLAKPSSQYKTRAWLAMLGISLFCIIYLALTLWFSWSSYYLIFVASSNPDTGVFELFKGGCCALIALFFIKGLFFKKQSGGSKDFQITREDQPRLFEFLDRLAEETKAPRPHKVFLSGGVNACVFYDLSILNFFFSGKKNLEIGLGLVNGLNLSEFKAVLAHEFGHFAQSTMNVGRWVYIAQQVATQLIYHRDWFDSLLSGVSRVDLRIAWIGWVLRIIVWAIRAILDTLLSFVMLAHRALSREMEFQADLVAVKNTGSDALVNALHQLSSADSAWSEVGDFVNSEAKRGFAVEDLFMVQRRIIEQNRRILDDPEYGIAPTVPNENPASHRVFTADFAQPPQMWSTHPANHLREENTKKTYIKGALNQQPAWCVFLNSDELRKEFTKHLLEGIDKPVCASKEAITELDKGYDKHYLNPEYRGAYLGRSFVSEISTIDQLYTENAPTVSELYPENLKEDLEKSRNLKKESALLKALKDRHFEPMDGVIRFRGDTIKRSYLSEAIKIVEADLQNIKKKLFIHDQKCRTYHRELAQKHSSGWLIYLQKLTTLIHYADHSFRNLLDSNERFQNTLHVVLADGNVSSGERRRLLADANEIHQTLSGIHHQGNQILLNKETAEHMEKPIWKDNYEELKLPAPNENQLGEWIDALSGWVNEMLSCLSELKGAALECLLDTEKALLEADQEGRTLGASPAPPSAPADYLTMLSGNERTIQTKLNFWDSFQTASGIAPASLRFIISSGIVGGAIWLTYSKSSILELYHLIF